MGRSPSINVDLCKHTFTHPHMEMEKEMKELILLCGIVSL